MPTEGNAALKNSYFELQWAYVPLYPTSLLCLLSCLVLVILIFSVYEWEKQDSFYSLSYSILCRKLGVGL